MRRRFRVRATAATLLVSLALTTLGVVALALQPTGASAGVTPGVKPDFELSPGGSATKEYSNVLINSAEVRPEDADACRDDPAISLTCSAHRIKLHRQPGYFLRISTTWLYRDAAGTSVPDVDTYLFDGPTSQYDYNTVGGVSGAVPETIKLVDPKQDEYDVVIHAYAGAIIGHTVSVEYTNAASAPTPGVPHDFLLLPHAAPVEKEFSTTLLVPSVSAPLPDTCRTDPLQDTTCDVYRLKLNRNLGKDAVNFVVITLSWDPVETPDLSTPAAGLGGEQVPNLDMYLFDSPTHPVEGTGGNLFLLPERAGFVAMQDEFDLVITTKRGPGVSYKISAFMTDEIFGKPFEFLDPVTGAIVTPGPDGELRPVEPSGRVEIPPLALAPVEIDQQIAGIGLGQTEQFDAEALRIGGQALRRTETTPDPPSGLLLVLALGVVPGGALGAGVFAVRRRHVDAF